MGRSRTGTESASDDVSKSRADWPGLLRIITPANGTARIQAGNVPRQRADFDRRAHHDRPLDYDSFTASESGEDPVGV
jgi:hypothetical protein